MRNDSADARALIASHRYQEAVPVLQRAIAQAPQDPEPRCLLAICLINLGKPREGAEMAGSAIALDPHAEWPHRIRSQALAAVGKGKKALQEAEEAVRSDPDEARALFLLGEQLLRRFWRRKRAADAVRRGLALDPNSAVGLELLGRIELSRRRWKEAEVAYRGALAIHPQEWALMNNLAIALRRQGKEREGIAMFENAARANPRSKLAQRNLFISTRRYVGFSFFALILLVNGARVLKGYWNTNPAGATLVLLILVGVTGAVVLIRLRRRQQLSPITKSFYAAEGRRELVRTVPFLAVWFVGALTIVFASIFALPVLKDGALVLMVGGVLAWWFGWRYLWRTAVRPWVEARF